ncbi:MAG: enoyl-CoA hydratase/isomerase family protein, partial [Roseomonas sp.]|nr:enoyl-CoA hydratase/isomerase family protein [Roseomonas sp.]
MTEAVLYDFADGLARITLNRPDARNALNIAMCEALIAAARRAREDGARCVIVRGEGPVFCAGADLKERQGMSDDAVRARRLKAFAAY